jgi:CRISPR/Cas system Type II protein with McrA/HNH and RuvC-like nuclease domain
MSPDKRLRVFNKTGGRCWYCGIELKMFNGEILPDTFMVDHAHPKKLGGSNAYENLVPSCSNCNETKNHKTVEQFRILLAHRAAGIEKFTQNQIAWLRGHGIEIPVLPAITFWFEKQAVSDEHRQD